MIDTHTVYVLYLEKYDKIYVGRTRNLTARFRSHNELGTKGWTIRFSTPKQRKIFRKLINESVS